MHTVKRVCFIGFGLLLFSLELQAQVVRVIDNKGTISNVNNNQVTTAATAPTSPLEGDIWFNNTDANNIVANVYDGSAWQVVPNNWLGNRTVHHNATTVLAITEALHNNAEIHVESTGDLSITNTDVSDATNFYITNTTATNRTLTFTGFAGAYLRNGGIATDVSTGGLTPKANTRYLAHITNNGGSYYFNATEAGSSINAVPLWKSNANGGSYATNDLVNYNGTLYKNLTGTNTAATPNNDATNWAANVSNWSSEVTKVSGVFDAGVDVNLGNYKVRIPTSGNRSLQIATIGAGTTAVIRGQTEAVFGTGYGTVLFNFTASNTYTYLNSPWTFATGHVQRALIHDTTNDEYYKLEVVYNTSWLNNAFHFERLSADGFAVASNTAIPTWTSNTNGGVYATNDIVNHAGILYKNLTGTNADTTPSADATNWGTVNTHLGNRTVHHNVTTTLAITEALHNNADIHVESTGDLSITNTDVSDATNFYITNTTAADRTLTFSGFAGAYLRNGGAENDVSTTGLTLKANTRYMAHVTENSGSFFFNATEAGAVAVSTSDKISQRENLGNSTTLGTVFNTQAASRNFIDVLNSYSVIDYTQDEVNHILSHREDFKIEILLGDRRGGTVLDRIDNFVLGNGDAAQLFPLIVNSVYDFSVTLTSAGQLTVTDNHVSQANTFGGIRGIKISKNTWKPNGTNERIGLNTAVLEGAVLTSGPSVNETLWGPRMISVPYAERNTYLFIPRDSRGGVAIIKAAGWEQEHWYGLLTWRDAGGGGAIANVTLTSLSTSGDLSMTAAVSTANNQAIVFTFTGVHTNDHGWNFTIID
jgi:hypothetical protein